MKTLFVFPLIVAVLSATLISCSGKNQNANIGGVVGATLCGGSAYALTKGRSDYTAPITFISAIACGMGFSSIGAKIDEFNNALLQKTMNETPDGEQLSWNIPQVNDAEITVSPTKTFKNEVEEYCREYKFQVAHNGKTSFGSGLVCRNSQTGDWYEVGTPTLSEM